MTACAGKERMRRQMRKEKFKRKLMAIMIGVLLFSAAILGNGKEVQAAAPPTIGNLTVAKTTDGNGVIAQCSYQHYSDQSGCEMRLYLYKIENDTTIIQTQKRLSYAEQGNESTIALQVEEGIYLAAVTMDYGTNIRQYSSEHYYKVRKVDGKYEVTEEHDGTDGQVVEAEACSHRMDYAMVKQATPTSDSVLAYECVICGAVLDYVEVPNSAYAAFLKEAADAITNAQTNEVIVSTDRWMSFNRNVFDAMKNRADVTVIVNYQYQGEKYQVIIPAGTDVNNLMDENGFGGFRHIEDILKTNRN